MNILSWNKKVLTSTNFHVMGTFLGAGAHLGRQTDSASEWRLQGDLITSSYTKTGPTEKAGDGLFKKGHADGNGFMNWKRVGLYNEIIFYPKTLQEIVQRRCECSIPESVKGQVGKDSELLGLVEGDPAHSREVTTTWPLCFSFNSDQSSILEYWAFQGIFLKQKNWKICYIRTYAEVIIDSNNCGIMTNFLVHHGICVLLNC